MRRHRPSPLVVAVFLSMSAISLTTPARASAQPDAQAPPAYLAVVDGTATLERDGQSQPAEANVPFTTGDRVRTTRGRLEIVFPDGARLDVDEYSLVELQSSNRLRLMQGRARLSVPAMAPTGAARYQIDTPAASARFDGAGDYRIAVVVDASWTATELATLRGTATLLTDRGTMPVQAGEVSLARDGDRPSLPQAFDTARLDAFDRWSAAQDAGRMATTSSGEYLPPGLQMFGGTLEQNGAWEYDEPYGYVWYPRVAATWRPYFRGRWSATRSYGWTWIGADRWSWPTDHYGRWGFRKNAWFWIPGRTWAPAWVSWAATPGYVSWCPLGFDGRPLSALALGETSFAPGWVIVPRTVFGDTGYRIDLYAVSTRHFAHDTPFVRQSVAPVAPPKAAAGRTVTMPASAGAAVPRAVAPQRYPPTIRVDRAPAPTAPASPASVAPPPPTFRAPLVAPRRAPEVVAPRWSTPSEPVAPRWARPAPQRSEPPAARREAAAPPHVAPRAAAPAAPAPTPSPRENVMPTTRGAATPAPHAKARGGR